MGLCGFSVYQYPSSPSPQLSRLHPSPQAPPMTLALMWPCVGRFIELPITAAAYDLPSSTFTLLSPGSSFLPVPGPQFATGIYSVRLPSS